MEQTIDFDSVQHVPQIEPNWTILGKWVCLLEILAQQFNSFQIFSLFLIMSQQFTSLCQIGKQSAYSRRKYMIGTKGHCRLFIFSIFPYQWQYPKIKSHFCETKPIFGEKIKQ